MSVRRPAWTNGSRREGKKEGSSEASKCMMYRNFCMIQNNYHRHAYFPKIERTERSMKLFLRFGLFACTLPAVWDEVSGCRVSEFRVWGLGFQGSGFSSRMDAG